MIPAAHAETQPDKSKQMTLFQATVLGLVEGLTEYLPISSTGHLLLARDLLGMDSLTSDISDSATAMDAINAYLVVIQFGAILAILVVCAHRFKRILMGIFKGDTEGRRLLSNLILALLPAIVIGLILEGYIKQFLFGIYPVILAWFVGGVAILVIAFIFKSKKVDLHQGKAIEDITVKTALMIGLVQCLAMWPGVSRSLATILGGLFLGLSMQATVEFSFLLGAVTLSAASVYDLLKHGQDMLALFDFGSMLLGLLVAFGAAILSVKWMIGYLNKYGLELFGYYRIVIAIAALWYFI
jgi:undecaprenyl-diphosphatase